MLDVKSRVQQELCNPLLGAALPPDGFLPCSLCQNLPQHRAHSGLPLLLRAALLLLHNQCRCRNGFPRCRKSFGAMWGKQGGKAGHLAKCGTAEALLPARPAWASSWHVPRPSWVTAPSLPQQGCCYHTTPLPFSPRKEKSTLENGAGVNYI